MKGRNDRLTGLCLKKINTLLNLLGEKRPVVCFIAESTPIEQKDYEEFASFMALKCVALIAKSKELDEWCDAAFRFYFGSKE